MDNINQEKLNNGVEDIPKLRTFQSDIADALVAQKGSVIRVAIKEQERKQQEGDDVTSAKKSIGIYIVIGGILLLLSFGVFGYYFWKQYQNTKEVIVLPTKRNFVNGDHATEIVITDFSTIPQRIKETIDTINPPVGQIEQLVLVTKDEKEKKSGIDIQDIFSSYFITPPENFNYSLVTDTYLFGTYQTTEPTKFLLLKTKVFSNTFAETYAWEKTMAKDFTNFLGTDVKFEDTVIFKDKIIKNEDVRVAYVGDREVFAYTFFGPKKELLLITKNTDTIGSLVTRFTTKLLEQ